LGRERFQIGDAALDEGLLALGVEVALHLVDDAGADAADDLVAQLGLRLLHFRVGDALGFRLEVGGETGGVLLDLGDLGVAGRAREALDLFDLGVELLLAAGQLGELRLGRVVGLLRFVDEGVVLIALLLGGLGGGPRKK
jgi:hypothetical protein